MTKQELIEILNNHPCIEWFNDNPNKFYFSGYYSTHYGEYERPEYQIVRYKNGYGIKGFYFYHQRTAYIPNDGRISDEKLHEILMECERNTETWPWYVKG